MNEVITRPSFQTIEQAWEWLGEMDLEYSDNFRFAFTDDHTAVGKYEDQQNYGCCGSFDAIIEVDGRRAYIGCNYGH